MTKEQIARAADAYEAEREIWGMRNNKAKTPMAYEVVRVPRDADPQVMASSTDYDTASREFAEKRSLAAMKAALAAAN